MVLLILGGLLIPPILVYIGLIGWLPAVIAEFVILLAAAWNFDRGRRPGAPGPVWDAAAPDFAAPMDGHREIPTQAVEDPEHRSRPARPG
jgi:hypothetical protein